MSQARITRILHSTDFSASSERAYAYAALLARLTGAELHLLHVIRYPEELRPSEAELRKAYREAEEHLVALGHEANGAQVRTAVRIGTPHAEVIRYAKEEKVDLVVMGTVGLASDAVTPVGSTAEKVIRGLNVPVLTIKAPPAAARKSGRRCAMCGGPATDVICDACKDRVRGEAVSRRRG